MISVQESGVIIQNFAVLRLLVSYLGEAHMAGWWQTSCLDETGRQYLEMNFPRSALSAGVHTAGAAAQRVHDDRIGKARVFHLFRLPYRFEDHIHAWLLNSDQDALWSRITDKDVAKANLRELSGRAVQAPEGPVKVGSEEDIDSLHAVQTLASYYLASLDQGRGSLSLPYFTAKVDS